MFYDLYVDLLDSDPAIWRRLRLDPALGLAQLHRIVTMAMGWSGRSDYRFQPFGSGDGDLTDITLLSQLITQPGDGLLYSYDGVRGWRHKITLEARANAFPYPGVAVLCLAGEGSGPPEFCDGVWGYAELLERLNDSDDPEYDQLWQQVGYDFDPYAFNLDTLNQQLQTLT